MSYKVIELDIWIDNNERDGITLIMTPFRS